MKNNSIILIQEYLKNNQVFKLAKNILKSYHYNKIIIIINNKFEDYKTIFEKHNDAVFNESSIIVMNDYFFEKHKHISSIYTALEHIDNTGVDICVPLQCLNSKNEIDPEKIIKIPENKIEEYEMNLLKLLNKK